MDTIKPLRLPHRSCPIPVTTERSVNRESATHRRWPFHPEALSRDTRQVLFIVAAALCLMPWVSPPVALALGAILTLTHENPFPHLGKKVSAKLLQVCVVFLGFGMDLPVVFRTGLQGANLAAATIATTFGLGWILGKRLGIDRKVSTLISAGTAICGGSAIAAVGSVIGVGESEISVAMGTVFILNAVALYAFPVVGHALGLTQVQFGTWAGIASAGTLVYRLFCARLGGSQFCAWDGRHIPGVGARGNNRSDTHSLSDRRGAVGENAARGWLATVFAGRPSLALHQRRFPCGHCPLCSTGLKIRSAKNESAEKFLCWMPPTYDSMH
jgi:hypothetical protein